MPSERGKPRPWRRPLRGPGVPAGRPKEPGLGCGVGVHHWATFAMVNIADGETAKQFLKFLVALDELDDVRKVNSKIKLASDLQIV